MRHAQTDGKANWTVNLERSRGKRASFQGYERSRHSNLRDVRRWWLEVARETRFAILLKVEGALRHDSTQASPRCLAQASCIMSTRGLGLLAIHRP